MEWLHSLNQSRDINAPGTKERDLLQASYDCQQLVAVVTTESFYRLIECYGN